MKKPRKNSIDFWLENWLWKSNVGTLKFVSLPWKLNNPYYHTTGSFCQQFRRAWRWPRWSGENCRKIDQNDKCSILLSLWTWGCDFDVFCSFYLHPVLKHEASKWLLTRNSWKNWLYCLRQHLRISKPRPLKWPYL